MKYKYKILANYFNDPEDRGWDDWQVSVFSCRKDAQDYIDKTVARYAQSYEPKYHVEMKAVKVTEAEGKAHNTMLNTLLD